VITGRRRIYSEPAHPGQTFTRPEPLSHINTPATATASKTSFKAQDHLAISSFPSPYTHHTWDRTSFENLSQRTFHLASRSLLGEEIEEAKRRYKKEKHQREKKTAGSTEYISSYPGLALSSAKDPLCLESFLSVRKIARIQQGRGRRVTRQSAVEKKHL
jgi:hypothetical protein